ncbi:substrate-binding domain-containing protein, partial [Enterococcus faecium]
IVIPPAIFFYYSTLFDSRFKTLQQNHLAAKLVKFLKNKNKRVMEQLSIIGFDDITFAELMDPALTTIRLNPGNKGAIAFHQLIGLAKQEEIKNQVLLLEGELISRDSVHKIK